MEQSAAVFLVLGLLVTGVAGWTARDTVRDRRRQRFDVVAEQTRSAIERLLASHAEALFGLRSLFTVDPEVTRADFHDYVAGSDVIGRLPGAAALSFNRMVPGGERAAFEARVRRDTSLNGVGYPNVAVHPPGNGDALIVVEFVEPIESNEATLGFDLTSDLSRRSALEEARDSGELAGSAPIRLVQGPRGFLLFLAVYDGRSLPVTPPARRRHFTGVVAAAFITARIIDEALGTESRVDFDIYDVGLTVDPPPSDLRAATVVYDGPRDVGAASAGGLQRRLDLNVGTRRWQIAAVPGPGFVAGVDQWLPWEILVSGLALTLLASGLAVSFGRSRRLAVGLARQMTADLAEREGQLREANQRLIGSNERLMEADRTRTALLSVVSHELQTPLTSIVGFSNLLVERPPGIETDDYARRIARNASILSNVISELVEFTRLERGVVTLTIHAVALSDLVPQVVDQLETVLSEHRIELNLARGVQVAADTEAVTRILANLLANAAKFAPRGTPIRVGVTADGQWGGFSIEDEGPGIPEGERARVFEPFFRGERAVGFPGTGVGLAVVAQLTNQMGGTAAITEAAGGGARVTVTLPLWKN